MQLHDLGLADLGELLEPCISGRRERPSGRFAQPGRKVAFRFIAPPGRIATIVDRFRDDPDDLLGGVETGVSRFLVSANAIPVAVSAYA